MEILCRYLRSDETLTKAAEVPAFRSHFQFLHSASGVLPETHLLHLLLMEPWQEFLQLGEYATHATTAFMQQLLFDQIQPINALLESNLC